MNPMENQTNLAILGHLSEGRTIKEIALLVFASKRSVERNIRKMKGEADCKNNAELVSYAHKNNILKGNDTIGV